MTDSDITQSLEEEQVQEEQVLKMVNQINWDNPEPLGYMEKAVYLFGVPKVLAPQKRGNAAWFKQSMKLNPLYGASLFMVEIRDEAVMDGRGVVGFCHVYIKYDVLPKCSGDVTGLHDGIAFDKQTKTLRVRAPDVETGVALLMVATAVGNCVITAKKIKQKNVIERAIQYAHEKRELFAKQLTANLNHAPGSSVSFERFV